MSILNNFVRLFVQDEPKRASKQEHRGIMQAKGTTADQIIDFFGFSRSKAGEKVGVQEVLGLSTVWRAIQLLSGSIAGTPIVVYNHNEDGTKNKALNHPVHRLLTVSPSPLFTPFTLLQTMVTHVLLTGNAYAYIHRERVTGYPKKLTIIEPSRVSLHVMENDTVVYKVSGLNRTYKPKDILHFGGLSWTGLAGINVLEYLADNFGLALANQAYLSNFYADGATLAGVITHPAKIDDGTMLRLRKSWQAQYGGSANSGKTAILEQGMEYKPIGLSPQQASAGDTKKITTSDVARIFGIPQFFLEDYDGSTFSNIQHLSLLYEKHTVRPWCKSISQECNRKLFPADEQGVITTAFDLDDLRMTDIESRAAYIETMLKYGVLNRDEVREREHYNPIPDGSGKIHFVPMNMENPAALPTDNQNKPSDEEE